MKKLFFETDASWSLSILRILLGVVVLAHGAQKLLGLFGGYGFTGTMTFFTDTMGLPWLVGFVIILLESVGAVALIAGIATRFIAFAYTLLALGIVFTTHIQNGFFMNWFGNMAGEGYEYFLLWIGMSLALFISGGGKYSLDRVISPKQKSSHA
ncbi:DoxX family protein [Sabulibacter ruber]|uniref:DoxX family protein n=1 Tax=Sabulibacter ruber TaxID=2811901 RepID=UPI001A95A42C|nr:DoxX family protein [Sabulibacter ruber]